MKQQTENKKMRDESYRLQMLEEQVSIGLQPNDPQIISQMLATLKRLIPLCPHDIQFSIVQRNCEMLFATISGLSLPLYYRQNCLNSIYIPIHLASDIAKRPDEIRFVQNFRCRLSSLSEPN